MHHRETHGDDVEPDDHHPNHGRPIDPISRAIPARCTAGIPITSMNCSQPITRSPAVLIPHE